MSVCTLHLLSLSSHPSIEPLLSVIPSLPAQPLLVATPHHWVIAPEKLTVDPLLRSPHPWDAVIVFANNEPLPQALKGLVRGQWSLPFNVSTEMLDSLPAMNQRILHPQPGDIPPLKGSEGKQSDHADDTGDKDFEFAVTPALRSWFRSFAPTSDGRRAVTMLNWLAFNPGGRERYMGGYVPAFAAGPGKSAGITAKLIGAVDAEKHGGWEAVGIVHYPSITHFEEMLDSESYKDVDREYKFGVLKDTAILCVSEFVV